MKILSFDHGAKSGYAYIIDGAIVCIDDFIIVGNSDQEKFVDFWRKVKRIIERYRADIIAVEKPMSFKNAFTSRTLIGYYSIIVLLAGLNNIPVHEVYPTSMKKKITGNGRATKEEVCNSLLSCHPTLKKEDLMVITPYKRKKGIKKIDYDKSDALALALYTHWLSEENMSP